MLATVSNIWTQWTHLASFITHNDSKLKTLVANAVTTCLKQVQSAQFAEDSKQTQWMKAESGEEEFESEEGEELAMEEEEQANKGEGEANKGEGEANKGEEKVQEGEEEANKGEEEANKGEEKVQEGEQDNLAPSLRTRCEQQSLTMSLSMAWQWLKQD